MVDVALLEHALREDLNARCPRVMAVLRPLEVVIENFPEGRGATSSTRPTTRRSPTAASRKVPFSRVLYVERDDFREDPPKEWFRLAPGREVRLRYACLIRCRAGREGRRRARSSSSAAPRTRLAGRHAPDGRKVKGTIHWVSAAHAVPAEVRLYDRLFTVENPGRRRGDFLDEMNPDLAGASTGAQRRA